METAKTYTFDLFGQDFSITTEDGNTEELKKISDYYKRTVNELVKKFPNRPQLNLAILAGLKITDELYNLAKNKKVNLLDDEKKIDELLNEALKQLDISISL